MLQCLVLLSLLRAALAPTPVFAIAVSQTVGGASGAPAASTFRARLSTVPIDVAMQSTVAGTGAAIATLTGNRLTVTGTFAGLKSPATTAKLHAAPKGIRGPAILDLTVSPGLSGSISGVLELSAQQQRDLVSGRLYVQLQSEKAPDGNLWGWLLPQEKRP